MSEQPRITVRKIGTQQFISTELLYAYGAITREEATAMGYTPPPPPTRLQRLRWSIESWWWDHKPHLHLGPCDHNYEGDE